MQDNRDLEQIIFHIDVNSAFLSWSAIRELANGSALDLRTVPSIVGGSQENRHGIVLAKSQPAKAYDIHTAETVASAFQKCPGLFMVAPDHKYYREMSRKLMDYLYQICPEIEQVSIDECYMNFTPICHRYASPMEAAVEIKDGVHDALGFTVNVGISDRKVLAKMASDFQKPDRIHTLFSDEIQQKLWPLPISKLHMCGKSSAKKFRDYGILTIGDLARSDLESVAWNFKSHGRLLWNYANGLDTSMVVTQKAKAKGVGNSKTLSRDVTEAEAAYRELRELAESVGRRLHKTHVLAGAICTEIKYSTFQSVSHQCLMEMPTATTEQLYHNACRLFDELWDGTPIRLLGIRATKLVDEDEPVQLSIFDLQRQQTEDDKKQKLDAAVDLIRKKYGEGAIQKGG